jgi:hypothetical protein
MKLTDEQDELTLPIVRDTLGTALYFTTYESCKQLLTTVGGDGTQSNPLAVLAAGGMCGIVSWSVICKLTTSKAVFICVIQLMPEFRSRRRRKVTIPEELFKVRPRRDSRTYQDRVL